MQIRAIVMVTLLYSLISCNTAQENNPLQTDFLPQREKAHPTILNPDSIQKPDTLIITGQRQWMPRSPEVLSVINYKQGTFRERQVRAGDPTITHPGLEGIPLPVITSVRDTFQLAGIPKIIPAKDAYFPGNNSQSFSYYTRLQGLPHDDLSTITEDRNGNMWLGTYGGGAIRFDGLNFYHYSDTEGLSQNYIISLTASRSGDIWLGTRAEGAIRFNGRNMYYYQVKNGLTDNRVETIFEDSKGNIWLGTYNGVCMFDGQKTTCYSKEHGLGIEVVYVILEDENENMWFGGRNGGITRFDGNAFYNFTSQQGLVDDYIVTGTYDSHGNLWFGSYENGACRFDGTTFFPYTTGEGLENNMIRSISEDNKGNIWIGSSMGSLTSIKQNNISFYNEEHGLTNGFVTSFFHDTDGSMWFGTYGGGLGHFKGNIFTHYNEKHGLKDGFIRSIMQDRDGHVWLGTNSAGLLRFDGTRVLNYSTQQGLNNNRIGGILQEKNGLYWFATTGGGISSFDGQVFTHYTSQNGLTEDFLLASFEDTGGNLWFVTRDNGVLKFNGEYFLSYGISQGLSDNNARCIMEDHTGNIWIGTRAGGINKFDGNTFSHYTTEGGLVSNNILDMMEDSSGNIWIGNNGKGATKFDGEYFYHFSESEGLINDFVYSLLEDKNKNIWFGTRMGLSKLLNHDTTLYNNNPGQQVSRQKILFANYTHKDGYIGIGTNSRAMFQDTTGNIWIGANDILTIYNPNEDNIDSIPPKTHLTSVKLFNEKTPWDKLFHKQDSAILLPNGLMVKDYRFDDLTNWYGLPQNLSLAYDNNHLSISYVGIGNSFKGNISYQYMLEGLDNNWSIITKETEVSFGRLAPGKYNFRVKAVNNDGFWSDETHFNFRINPPIYKSNAAYILYLVFSMLTMYLLFLYQKKLVIRKEQAKLKDNYLKQEVAIARQSAEFKQNFLANMSHELRTPLTGVLGMANLLSRLPLDKKAKEYVDDLNRSGEGLKDTINMILDISKIEAGKLKLRNTNFSLHNVMDNCVRLFSPICKENVTIESYIDNQIPRFIYSDEQRINQIIKNFLSNAVKFTHHGKITLRALLEQNDFDLNPDSFTIRIIVSDTGPGIEYQEQKKLFTPFYQSVQNHNIHEEGTGLGLAICKELSILLGGHIGVDSKPGNGSSFWFTFRTKKGANPKTNDKPFIRIADSNAEHINSLNILLVEDKQLIQKVVSLMLNSMGHSVAIAVNGKDALDKYTPGVYDLILMDIQMPVMDGITATQKLREMHPELPPVVGLSANAFEGDRQKYMDKGLDEYLTKPILENDFENLLKKFKLG